MEFGHSLRKSLGVKVRQTVDAEYQVKAKLDPIYEEMLSAELNIRHLSYSPSNEIGVKINDNYKTDKELISLGLARDLIREVQTLRKNLRLTKDQRIKITAYSWPEDQTDSILAATSADSISLGDELKIELI